MFCNPSIPAASRSRTQDPASSGGVASISATADRPSAEKEHLMLSTVTQLPSGSCRRARLRIVLAAVLGAVAVGAFASSAHADDALLPLPGTCPNENNAGTDWGSVDAQRTSVACLINEVRAKAGLPQLLYCTTSAVCNYIT